MFAARPAADILAGDEDLRIRIGCAVHQEVRRFFATADRDIAPAGEQAVGQAGLAHRLHLARGDDDIGVAIVEHQRQRSEEHTSELQSLMRISYAVFCLKKKTAGKQTDKLTRDEEVSVSGDLDRLRKLASEPGMP